MLLFIGLSYTPSPPPVNEGGNAQTLIYERGFFYGLYSRLFV
ncbi:hypothetical protein SAMN05660649_05034 [Desulfotomaculum arcticum]|uniref:Uncharacterized protein n=1 Tax=Desulfotruncus arcticus DSM 17038 TaxID=1121424 RepID=A0A1I2ZNT5_9FIRM|nr:hypothetical protein SAMN05660649_05034 [Desulfotomaculum arcticum] [Desulfotruncus arcticus DSM 17038]